MELAENVKRNDFNPMELAEGLSKRKELYEAIHPETKHNATFKGNQFEDSSKTKSDIDRFTEDTAKRIGKSETFVKEHLQLNDIKIEDKQKVRDNKLNKSEALAIFRKEKKIAQK